MFVLLINYINSSYVTPNMNYKKYKVYVDVPRYPIIVTNVVH